MWPSIIAVVGTLLGGALTGLLQIKSARIAQRAARADQRAEALRRALGELVAALGDHRRAMWHREVLRLDSASEEAVEAARMASRATRSAITGPLVAVSVLERSLAEPARQAAVAAFNLRYATDHSALASLREAAITATDELVAAASQAMA
ncbi:protein kilB [Streptantibioticus rubrisoli]|uniref:Protein kilB n=1 Tax=Streptantibioticus rubrisoli TaxID=1387313 RepID=A0ABT1PD17_9ACTN|nr:protein kilB [Streptantibioticus rubrisoli]MCQ4043264.1 protein kilB [Streptantibioticus rubrisoli]